MYAEYTQPQLTFLALVPWKDETNLKQILRNGEQQKKEMKMNRGKELISIEKIA